MMTCVKRKYNAECPDCMQCAKIKQHLENDCEHTVILCKYERIGCDVKMKRKDMSRMIRHTSIRLSIL